MVLAAADSLAMVDDISTWPCSTNGRWSSAQHGSGASAADIDWWLPKTGRTIEDGQRYIEQRLIISTVTGIYCALKESTLSGSRLARMLQAKPRMLVAIALANKPAFARQTFDLDLLLNRRRRPI